MCADKASYNVFTERLLDSFYLFEQAVSKKLRDRDYKIFHWIIFSIIQADVITMFAKDDLNLLTAVKSFQTFLTDLFR